MDHRRDARSLLLVSLASALVLFVAFTLVGDRATALGELPLDDAWIHLVYARGLSRDLLPTFNPGVPEAGFSSLAWLFAELPAAIVSRFASPVVAAKLTSLACATMAALGSGLLARRLGSSLLGASLAVVATLFSPGFAFSALSGMEVCLATALMVWGFLAFVEERDLLAGALFGLATITRLEATLVLGVVALLSGRRRMLRLVAPGALLLSLWGVYDLFVTGHLLPNTFYVKASRSFAPSNVRYFVQHVVTANGLLSSTLVLALAALSLLRRERVVTGLFLAATLPCLAIVRTHGFSDATFYTERYFFPFTALLPALMILGLESLKKAWVVPAGAGLIALATLPALVRTRQSYQGHCATIRKVNVEPAWWIARNVPRSAVIGVIDAGASRFLGEHTTVDLGGLNEHHIAHAGSPARERCFALASGFTWVVLPAPFLDAFRGGFVVEERARYQVDRWFIVEPPRPATVVVARTAIFPPLRDACLRELKANP